jgi:hypothetical protein
MRAKVPTGASCSREGTNTACFLTVAARVAVDRLMSEARAVICAGRAAIPKSTNFDSVFVTFLCYFFFFFGAIFSDFSAIFGWSQTPIKLSFLVFLPRI